MKIRPLRAEVFSVDERTDRQTDMTKLRVAFRNLSNESKNGKIQYLLYTDIRSESGSIHVKNNR